MFNSNFLLRYMHVAPLPLAIERSWECELLSSKEFTGPILDIGCGEGIFAHNLFDNDTKIDVGIDPNERELDRTKELSQYKELIKCFGDKIPKESGSYKTIFSNSVMEHIVDIEPVLQEAERLLANDGVMYLTLPTDKFDRFTIVNLILSGLGLEKLAVKWRKFSNKFWAHYHYYTPGEWEKMFHRNGFKLVEKVEYGSKLQCMLNDLMTPFCFPAFLVKKMTNKWFLSTKLRKFTTGLFYAPLFKYIAKLKKPHSGESGLVFFALKKIES